MNEILRVTIPTEPIPKGRPKIAVIGGHARAYTPSKTRSAEGVVRLFCQQAYRDKSPSEKALNVTIIAVMPIPKSTPKKHIASMIDGSYPHVKRPDLDNILKLCLDSMNGLIFKDDSQICHLECYKCYGEMPRTEIIVKEWT